jgi:cytochrome c
MRRTRWLLMAPPGLATPTDGDAVGGPVLTKVTLNSTGVNDNTYTSQTFPLDFAGTHRLSLVLRAVTDGSSAGLGNLNWVEFSGPGAGVNL